MNRLLISAQMMDIQKVRFINKLTITLKLAFEAFRMDNIVRVSEKDARALFDEMIKNTSEYLGDYLK